MVHYIEPDDLAEAEYDGLHQHTATTVAAQQCGLPEGLDATDMDMIRRGDMLGPVLGARVASLIQSQAARIAELEVTLGDLMSWFPDKPSEPEWRLKAGNYGADDAVTAARSLLNGERKG